MKETEVTCLCGDSVIRLRGEPQLQFYCHCDDCQATSGGAYVALAVFEATNVEIVRDNLESWTLKTMPRHRCKTCGTHMTATVSPEELIGVKANLLPEGAFNPTFHQHCRFAVLPVVDELPHFSGFPPEAGGTDERINW